MTVRPGYISDGNNNWIQIGPAVPVGSTVYYQASEPSSPQTGDIWIDADNDVPSIDNSQFLRWRKTVSGGETSLSGLDDSGLSLQYTPAYEQVYLNGVLLVRGQDYTATTGTSITGLTELAASDVVEVFSVVARVVGDVYTQSQTNSLLDTKSNVSTTGLVLVTSASVGSSVSSVTVSNCFSSTYDKYRVIYTGGTSSNNGLIYARLGSTTANYCGVLIYSAYNGSSVSTSNQNNASVFNRVGSMNTTDVISDFEILNPFRTKNTFVNAFWRDYNTVGTALGFYTGYLADSTSYTSFTILPEAGTISGGTIKVYGYK